MLCQVQLLYNDSLNISIKCIICEIVSEKKRMLRRKCKLVDKEAEKLKYTTAVPQICFIVIYDEFMIQRMYTQNKEGNDIFIT